MIGVESFRNRDGYTTLGAACAILLSCALIIGGVWAARSLSRAQGVQSVADSAALAAANEVAEFVIAVRVADATLLTMSLTGLGLLGVGAVCCCVPQASTIGERMIEAGRQVLDARDDYAQTQIEVLSAASAALPALAQTQAQLIASENAGFINGEAIALCELVPTTGSVSLSGDLSTGESAAQTVEDSASDIQEQGRIAQEASQQADEAYRAAFEADCGRYPGACAAQRAQALAGLPDEQNPVASSISTWSFQMALDRARAYYRARMSQEAGISGGSLEERCDSRLRYHYYEYACDLLQDGYVIQERGDVPQIYLPTLPRNTQEMKATALYTQRVYPVSDGKMHTLAECPGAQGGVEGYGSVSQLDAGVYERCASCGLSASVLGNVAAASTSIDNGFEHHYRAVSENAEAYCAAKASAAPALRQARGLLQECFDALACALEDVVNCRIVAYPPGRYGAVVTLGFESSPEQASGFSGAFEPGSDLGSFAAISAATLVEDPSDNVISGLLDGVASDIGPPITDLTDGALGLWSGILHAYGSGVDGLVSAVGGILDGLPLMGASGLGSWAREGLTGVIENCGLEPARTDSAKPVVINTAHVVGRGDGPLCDAIATAKGEEVLGGGEYSQEDGDP